MLPREMELAQVLFIMFDKTTPFMKAMHCLVCFFLTLTAKSQTTKDYINFLTSGMKQCWRLDSVGMNSEYTELKKEMIILFKLNNEAFVLHQASQKTDTLSWYLEKKERYFLLKIEQIGQYEIDFLQRKNVKYMRLRDEISFQKNIPGNEYFFISSKR
jgi:hypothetical protein